MKKLIFSLSIIFSASLIKAQEPTRTLFNMPTINQIGIYVAPEIQYGELKNGFTTFGGSSIMAIFNQKFAAGFSFTRSLDNGYSPTGISPLYLHTGMGGLKMEYTIHPEKAIHISVPMFIGMGVASADSGYSSMRNRYDVASRPDINRSNYLIFQPGVQVEANLFKYLKFYAGASYRFAYTNESSPIITSSSMGGGLVYAGIKAGIFDYTLKKK